MVTERFWQLLSRKTAGEATIQELEELDLLLLHNPSLKNFVHAFHYQNNTLNTNTTEAEAAWGAQLVKMQLSGRLKTEGKGLRVTVPSYIIYGTGAVIAAALILFLSFTGLTVVRERTAGGIATKKNKIVTEKGAASRITLPDSTEVWLNGDSKLVYAENFTAATREVTLSGEAFFKVAKDPSRPFIIHTDKINIKVVGTVFNLKNYPDDEIVETSLIHGKIEVTFKDRPSEKIILNPNEKLIVRKNQMEVPDKTAPPKVEINNVVFLKDSLLQETAWMKNKLVFTNERLMEIAKLLERKFDLSFEFTDEKVKDFSYTGIFENESIDKIMEVMSLSRHFSYSIQGRRVIVGK